MGLAKVVVVRTGTANLASVVAGLKRVGASPVVSEERSVIEDAARLVLPGVGTLAASMERLHEAGLVEPLQRRIREGRPTLSVCLGLQMLCEGSAENPGLEGLGVVPGIVTRFPGTVRVPQLGWNNIEPTSGAKMLSKGYVYFANSFRLEKIPEGWEGATADYAGSFVAALEKGAVLACQFHPELSGDFGKVLLKRWLDATDTTGGATC
jgi:imidazole glycerol-phosphate synthase subunit HisH